MDRRVCGILISGLLGPVLWALMASAGERSPQKDKTTRPVPLHTELRSPPLPDGTDLPRTDRSAFAGTGICRNCHRSEYIAWLHSSHGRNPVNRFETDPDSIAGMYRQLTGNTERCGTCHNLPAEERTGRRAVESGTSCESCHGAAGGETGWLNRHAVYGPGITAREDETAEHRRQRIAFCEQAGMLRAERQYDVARNCYRCHIVTDADLLAAGHPAEFDDFSLVPALLGEVRHNFHLDRRRNAPVPTLDASRRGQTPAMRVRVYFIAEQLARIHVALSALAALPDAVRFDSITGDEMRAILEDAAAQLEEFLEVLTGEPDANGRILSAEQIRPLPEILHVLSECDDATSDDLAAAADRIRRLSRRFVQNHSGDLLGALDAAFLGEYDEPIGTALSP